MRSTALCLLSTASLLLALGCGGEINVQENIIGLWSLETRTLPDGQVLPSSEITGWMEWFEMDENRGHVTVGLSPSQDELQFTGAVYAISGLSFKRETYLRIGGGYGSKVRDAYETPNTVDGGQIAVDGAKIVLTQGDGVTWAFDGESLTVTHRDGTVDTWKKAS